MKQKPVKRALIKLYPKRLLTFFQDQGMLCTLKEASENEPGRTLTIRLDSDLLGRKRFLHLNICPQKRQKEEDEVFVQVSFVADLPFPVIPAKLTDLSRFLFLLNRNCRFGGFELNEEKECVSYVYSSLYSEKISPLILKSIMGNIFVSLYFMYELIEEIASGDSTVHDMLDEVRERLQSLQEEGGSHGS